MNRLFCLLLLLAAVFVGLAGGWFAHIRYSIPAKQLPPIRVGILHSTTGPMAVSEQPVLEATLLAIEKINEEGGLLGRTIEPVLADGHSNEQVFARQAEKLIVDDQVQVLFGCWTSSSRKAVKNVVESHKHLLFYPVQYEGMEESPNIIYTGAAPNQQIIPAVTWAFKNSGKKIFLVGSDYIFPRAANEIIRDLTRMQGGEITGEAYVRLDQTDFSTIVQQIAKAKPEVIFNTLNGDANRAFLEALHVEHEIVKDIAIMSFSLSESELQNLSDTKDRNQMPEGIVAHYVGNYACWNYFQSVDNPENRDFINRFKKKYGNARVLGDPMAAAYTGVHLWAAAVVKAGSAEPERVLQALPGISFRGPDGLIVVDHKNNHTWKNVRIGRIRPDGQFDIVWETPRAVRPVPFPFSRSKSEWDRFLDDFYHKWGERWTNPGVQ